MGLFRVLLGLLEGLFNLGAVCQSNDVGQEESERVVERHRQYQYSGSSFTLDGALQEEQRASSQKYAQHKTAGANGMQASKFPIASNWQPVLFQLTNRAAKHVSVSMHPMLPDAFKLLLIYRVLLACIVLDRAWLQPLLEQQACSSLCCRQLSARSFMYGPAYSDPMRPRRLGMC